MDTVLIVSSAEKSVAVFREILVPAFCENTVTAKSCSAARQLLIKRGFDLVLINAPLTDESGEDLACHIAKNSGSEVILAVSGEHYEEISAAVEDYGVITVSKPLSRTLFWSALKMAKASHNRFQTLQRENNQLMKKIEDIRVVDRAKCVLIASLSMSENEAHRYIEKRAMNERTTKRRVAEQILKTYDGQS